MVKGEVMEKSLDETVYCLLNFWDGKIEAIGLKQTDGKKHLVGVYLFWDKYQNPREFLEGIVSRYGEAKLLSLRGDTSPGLVCQMSYDIPNLAVLSPDGLSYREMSRDLLEIRARNPKPFLSLHYDFGKKSWECKPVATTGEGFSV